MRLAVYVGIAILVIIGLVGGAIVFSGFFGLWRRRSRLSERLYRMHWQLSLSLLCQVNKWNNINLPYKNDRIYNLPHIFYTI